MCTGRWGPRGRVGFILFLGKGRVPNCEAQVPMANKGSNLWIEGTKFSLWSKVGKGTL